MVVRNALVGPGTKVVEHPICRYSSRTCNAANARDSAAGRDLIWLRSRSLQRFQIPQHCWDELRHGGMNVHCPLQHGVGSLGIHHIEDAVNDLVARKPEQGGTQNLFALAV